jgi:hypothetical protein
LPEVSSIRRRGDTPCALFRIESSRESAGCDGRLIPEDS